MLIKIDRVAEFTSNIQCEWHYSEIHQPPIMTKTKLNSLQFKRTKHELSTAEQEKKITKREKQRHAIEFQKFYFMRYNLGTLQSKVRQRERVYEIRRRAM